MISGVMQLIINFLLVLKELFFGDLSWDVLFFLCIATAGLAWWLPIRFTKQYEPEVLKKKWWGLGNVMHWVYATRNAVLGAFGTTAIVILYLSGVTAGSSRNGQIADCGSSMTTIPTGFYQIAAQFGTEPGADGKLKDLVYIRPINDSGKVSDFGLVFKAGPGEVSANTALNSGNFVDVGLSHGGTWISQVTTDQLNSKLAEMNNRAWNKIKRGVASFFNWVGSIFA